MGSRARAVVALIAGLGLVSCATSGGFPKVDEGKLRKARDVLREVKKLLPLTTEEEITVGKQVASRLQQTYGVYRNPTLEQYVALVGTAVSWQGSRRDIEYNFTILDTDEVNAFAAPGGFILVTRGLLARMRNESELATLLGHEIWHVEARHETKRIQEAQVAGTLASKALSAMSQEELSEVVDLCYSVLEKGRSRETEMETDIEGATLARRVGYDPRSLASLLDRLDIGSSEPALKRLMATHPPMRDRVSQLRARFGDATGALLEGRFEEHTKSLHAP